MSRQSQAKSLGMLGSVVDSHIPAVINAFHHPPKGAFAQCADDLICNVPQTEREDRKSRDRQNSSVRNGHLRHGRTHESAGRSTDSNTRWLHSKKKKKTFNF